MNPTSPPSSNGAVGLDIGSNTISCVELNKVDGKVEIVNDLSTPVRLSEGLNRGGTLKPSAVARGLMALERIVEVFDPTQKPLRAVGTAVFRLARNSEVFLEPAAEMIGRPIQILSGEEEAVLVGQSAAFGIEGEGAVISVDVGGQSTEICRVDGSGAPVAVSLQMGVVSLTDRYVTHDPPTRAELDGMRRAIQGGLRNGIAPIQDGRVIGVAGTATTLARLEIGIENWSRKKVHGLVVGRAKIRDWLERMVSLPAEVRASKYGVPPMRADVFPAGLLLFDCVLERLGRETFVVSANGLRFGVALDLLEG